MQIAETISTTNDWETLAVCENDQTLMKKGLQHFFSRTRHVISCQEKEYFNNTITNWKVGFVRKVLTDCIIS